MGEHWKPHRHYDGDTYTNPTNKPKLPGSVFGIRSARESYSPIRRVPTLGVDYTKVDELMNIYEIFNVLFESGPETLYRHGIPEKLAKQWGQDINENRCPKQFSSFPDFAAKLDNVWNNKNLKFNAKGEIISRQK